MSLAEVRVTVPPGIGDVFWVHRKLLPHVAGVHCTLATTGGSDSPVERRAQAAVASWPGVLSVSYARVSQAEFDAGLAGPPPLTEVLTGRYRGVYAVNRPLERGTPLEAIDPGPVAWDAGLPLALPDVDLPAGRYLLVYVSGDAERHKTMVDRVWSPPEWEHFVRELLARYVTDPRLPVVLVGAEFDRPALMVVRNAVARGRRCPIHLRIGPDPPALNRLLKDCWAFAAYQSGLSILADHLGAWQVMLYFPRLRDMGYSWVRPEHRGRRFNWRLFSESPVAAAADLRLPPVSSE